jgi:hypothetical protein
MATANTPGNTPAAMPPSLAAALATSIADADARGALFDSVVTDLGGAAFEAELNGPDSDDAVTRLLAGLAGGTL